MKLSRNAVAEIVAGKARCRAGIAGAFTIRKGVRLMDETRMSLIDRAKNLADEQSWNEFFNIYYPVLSNFVRARGIKQDHAVQDTVQDVLISLFRKLPELEFDKQRGNFRTYLWTIANNNVANWYRKNARHQKAGSLEFESRAIDLEQMSQSDPDKEFRDNLRKRVLEVALQQLESELSPQMWQRFRMHYLEKVPAAETARLLGCNTGAVSTAVSRAVARLRAICADHLEELDP